MKINFGSGQRKFDTKHGWVNVDCQQKWEPDVLAKKGEPLPFEKGSVEVIVMHHVLEHFGCGEADSLIREFYGLLKPGGRLIVSVPDITALYKGWISGALDEYQLMVNLYGAYMGDEADRHKWGYSFWGLRDYLHELANWEHVEKWDETPIPGADIAIDWWILTMEAVK